MQRLSKPFYLGTIAVAAGIGVILVIIMYALSQSGGNEAVLAIYAIMWVPMIYVAVVFAMLIYKMWVFIQDGHARTTPGKAVGFLFIPFFNFYWGFQALWGFARDYNNYLDRHKIEAPKLPEGIFIAYMVLCLSAWIPVLGMIAVIVNFFVALVMISKICDAVNALPDETPQPQAAAE